MTNLVPGILWIYFQNAILLTVPTSVILLFWYRRAVARSMRIESGSEVHSSGPSELDAAQRLGPTAEAVSQFIGLNDQDSSGARHAERRLRVRLLVIYGLAGIAAAAVMTALFILSPGVEFSVFRAFIIWYVFCWPIVPTLAPLLVIPQRKALFAFVGYVLIGVAIVLLWSIFSHSVLARADVSPLANARSFLTLLVQQAWLPYLLIVITGNRRLRTVSPLVLAGLLVFSFSALVVLNTFVAAFDYAAIREMLLRFGASSHHLWFMIAALPVGYGCWRGLRWLGQHFERKAFSDMQLLVDTWWLIVAFNNTVLLSSDFGWGGLLGLLAFVAYRLVIALGLALWRTEASFSGHRRLLLLRVFGFQRRTEKLFDGIGQRWRLIGSVKMIAGVDLAMRTIDPGDFITLLGGRLKQLFVQDRRDLLQRLERLDEARDPDGRFRISDFFCHDNTWRPTLKALLTRSDLVLMDLRGFSEANSGCLFELQQLAENGLLPRTVFVVDDTTDVRLLESTLTQHARQIGAIGSDAALPRLNVKPTKSQSDTELNKIYNTLHALVPV